MDPFCGSTDYSAGKCCFCASESFWLLAVINFMFVEFYIFLVKGFIMFAALWTIDSLLKCEVWPCVNRCKIKSPTAVSVEYIVEVCLFFSFPNSSGCTILPFLCFMVCDVLPSWISCTLATLIFSIITTSQLSCLIPPVEIPKMPKT